MTWTSPTARCAARFECGTELARGTCAEVHKMGYLFAALVGALVMFFLDPDRGAYRRNVSRDRLAGSGRDLGGDLGRTGRKLASDASGVKQRIANRDKDDVMPNDETL